MPNIIFEKRLEADPRKDTNIYKLKAPRVNEALLLQSARRFGLAGDRRVGQLVLEPHEIGYTEGSFTLTLGKRSGAIRFMDMMKFQLDDGKTNIRMSDENAIKTAKEFIRKYDLASLRECKPLRVTRLRVGTLKVGARRAQERVIDVGVLFQRFVDGLPVFGPGGKMMVYLDKNRDLIGVDRVWRDISSVSRPVLKRELHTPEWAESSLKRSLARSTSPKIRVKEMQFGYFEGGICDIQRTMQPAYVMPLRLHAAEDKMVMRSLHVIPAAERPVGRIMPRKQRRATEPVRR